MCISESETVKNDCPMQENYEIFKDLMLTVSLTDCSGDTKKAKKSFENETKKL